MEERGLDEVKVEPQVEENNNSEEGQEDESD
jgi:hypothetical protein